MTTGSSYLWQFLSTSASASVAMVTVSPFLGALIMSLLLWQPFKYLVQKITRSVVLIKTLLWNFFNKKKSLANHLPVCLGCFHSGVLSCLVFFCPHWIFQLSKSWKFHPISQYPKKLDGHLEIPRWSTSECNNTEVNEGLFPMSPKSYPT